MKKIIIFKVYTHSCDNHECCNPDPTIIPIDKWIEIEETDLKKLKLLFNDRYSYKVNDVRYVIFEHFDTSSRTNGEPSLEELLKEADTYCKEKEKKELANKKRLETKQKNSDKYALKRKLEKVEKLKKEIEELDYE